MSSIVVVPIYIPTNSAFVMVVQLLSRVWLCDPLDCSTPSFPVLHCLLVFAQIRLPWVGDAMQPSHPLLPPSPPAFNLSRHQDLPQWRLSFSPPPHWCCLFILMIAILTGVGWYLIVVLICISLLVSGASSQAFGGHLCVFIRKVFRSSAHCLKSMFCCWVVWVLSYILDINPN